MRSGECAGGHFLARRAARKRNLNRAVLRVSREAPFEVVRGYSRCCERRAAGPAPSAAYDTVAATYAVVLPDTSFEASLDLAIIQNFVDQLRDRDNAHILDAGCGAGRMITYLNSLDDDLTITGVDLSPTMIEHAKSMHPDNVIVEGDLAALPFPYSSVDGVLA